MVALNHRGAIDVGVVGANETGIGHQGAIVVDVKPNIEMIPIYELRTNSDEILDELEVKLVEKITFEGEEIEMTYAASKGFGKPLNATIDGRVKLEEPDPVSGMIPFIATV